MALVLCLPLVIQGLTGSMLVFQHEISNHFAFKNHTFAEGEKHKISEIIAAAKEEVPEGFKPVSVKFEEAATVRFSKKVEEKNQLFEVLIDPVSLEIIQTKNLQESFFNIIKKFHSTLLIKGDFGKTIVGIYGFVIMFMTISGIILWWPKQGKGFVRSLHFKFSSTGKKFHRDLHASVGFWLSVFLLITSFSGVYLTYPKATHAFIAKMFSARDLRESPQAIPNENGKLISVDEAIAIAGEENLISAIIPSKPDQAYRLNFAPKNYQDGEPMIVFFVDGWQKKILEKRDPKDYSIGETITVWQHSLHEGKGFSVIYQIIVFFLGLSILLFSITGVYLWILKRRKRAAEKLLYSQV